MSRYSSRSLLSLSHLFWPRLQHSHASASAGIQFTTSDDFQRPDSRRNSEFSDGGGSATEDVAPDGETEVRACSPKRHSIRLPLRRRRPEPRFRKSTTTIRSTGTAAGPYAQRFGAAVADITTQNFFSDAVLASLLHEDPRYFRRGPEFGVWYRVGYALSRVAVTRTDAGKQHASTIRACSE